MGYLTAIENLYVVRTYQVVVISSTQSVHRDIMSVRSTSNWTISYSSADSHLSYGWS